MLPEGLFERKADEALLSTTGFPRSGYVVNDATTTTAVSAGARRLDKRVVDGAPLYGNTGSLEARVHRRRPCTTAAENARDPWPELRWHPRVDRYLWGVRTPPRRSAQLFVVSRRLALRRPWADHPLRRGDDEIYELRDRRGDHRGSASDFSESNLHALGCAQRLLLTLGRAPPDRPQSIEIVECTYTSAGIAAPRAARDRPCVENGLACFDCNSDQSNTAHTHHAKSEVRGEGGSARVPLRPTRPARGRARAT